MTVTTDPSYAPGGRPARRALVPQRVVDRSLLGAAAVLGVLLFGSTRPTEAAGQDEVQVVEPVSTASLENVFDRVAGSSGRTDSRSTF